MEQYQYNLVQYFELEEFEPEAQQQLVEEITQNLEVRVFNRAYETLEGEPKQTLDGLVEEGDPEKVVVHLQEHVPELTQFFQEEMATLKKELDEQWQEMLDNAKDQSS